MALKQRIEKRGALYSKKTVYAEDEILNTSAQKKQAIVDMMDEGSQLTMLAIVVEQIGDAIALNTPEFTAAKAQLAEIKNVLGIA